MRRKKGHSVKRHDKGSGKCTVPANETRSHSDTPCSGRCGFVISHEDITGLSPDPQHFIRFATGRYFPDAQLCGGGGVLKVGLAWLM